MLWRDNMAQCYWRYHFPDYNSFANHTPVIDLIFALPGGSLAIRQPTKTGSEKFDTQTGFVQLAACPARPCLL
ncbi:hypothetical protein TALK_10960 [Thalassospira alkalitolerans]|uniref:Uncharacterized protein n=1 Tax=Thalassospira alkalitolerans TaxID=1293890 RepID=A0A1Y2LBN4_9PROT|nr:hypothetical protein TALK_10960 [Thalassospira alkalitolerans]